MRLTRVLPVGKRMASRCRVGGAKVGRVTPSAPFSSGAARGARSVAPYAPIASADPDFNPIEFEGIRNQAGRNSFSAARRTGSAAPCLRIPNTNPRLIPSNSMGLDSW